MDHHHQRTLADAGVVNLNAIGIRAAVGSARIEVPTVSDIRREQRRRSFEDNSFHRETTVCGLDSIYILTIGISQRLNFVDRFSLNRYYQIHAPPRISQKH